MVTCKSVSNQLGQQIIAFKGNGNRIPKKPKKLKMKVSLFYDLCVFLSGGYKGLPKKSQK